MIKKYFILYIAIIAVIVAFSLLNPRDEVLTYNENNIPKDEVDEVKEKEETKEPGEEVNLPGAQPQESAPLMQPPPVASQGNKPVAKKPQRSLPAPTPTPEPVPVTSLPTVVMPSPTLSPKPTAPALPSPAPSISSDDKSNDRTSLIKEVESALKKKAEEAQQQELLKKLLEARSDLQKEAKEVINNLEET